MSGVNLDTGVVLKTPEDDKSCVRQSAEEACLLVAAAVVVVGVASISSVVFVYQKPALNAGLIVMGYLVSHVTDYSKAFVAAGFCVAYLFNVQEIWDGVGSLCEVICCHKSKKLKEVSL